MRFAATIVIALACSSAAGQWEEVFTPGYGYTPHYYGGYQAEYQPEYRPSYQGEWRIQAQYGANHTLLRRGYGPQYGASSSIVVPNNRLYQFNPTRREYPVVIGIPYGYLRYR